MTISKNKSVATKYVNEGIEAVRSIRDNDWSDLTAADGTTNGLQFTGGVWSFSGASDYPDSPTNTFTRTVDVSCVDNDSCDIDVSVTWTSGGSTHSSQASTTFTKWAAY